MFWRIFGSSHREIQSCCALTGADLKEVWTLCAVAVVPFLGIQLHPYGLINPKQLFNIYLIRGIVKVSCYHISSLVNYRSESCQYNGVKPPWSSWSSHWIPRRCQGLSWIAGRINVATWDQKRTSGTGTRWDEVFAASVSRVPGSSYIRRLVQNHER